MFNLTDKQLDAIASLQRALTNAHKAGVGLIDINGTMTAYNAKMIQAVRSDTKADMSVEIAFSDVDSKMLRSRCWNGSFADDSICQYVELTAAGERSRAEEE